METTATYDKDTDEFVVNTPGVMAQKYWITNGACHAHFCVVFAQLFIDGKNEGVHGILVRIRNKDLTPASHVRVEDMGIKIGLNGIDNAKLTFNNVRVPRENLLSRDAQVAKGGAYKSKTDGRRNRFLKLADQLLSGRLCISSMMIGATKVVLTNTFRYAAARKGMGPSGLSDTPILDYQLFQHQTFGFVARMYALQFYHNYVKRRYEGRTEKDAMEVVILCSSIKPLAAWHCDKVVVTCREKVGGVGFLAANGYGEMFAHAGITAEGDARVLCMKVTKELLELVMKKKFKVQTKMSGPIDFAIPASNDANAVKAAIGSLARWVELLGVRLGKKVMELSGLLQNAVTSQEGEWKGLKPKQRFYKAQMEMYSPEIQGVAQAYGEWESLRAFFHVIESRGTAPDLLHKSTDGYRPKGAPLNDATTLALCRSALLLVFEYVKEDAIWLANSGLVSGAQLTQMQGLNNSLCVQLRPDIMRLIDGFGISDSINWRPLAKDWKTWNEVHNFGEVVDLDGGDDHNRPNMN